MARCIRDGKGGFKEVARFDTRLMMSPKDIFPKNIELASRYIVKKDHTIPGSLAKMYKVEDKSSLVRKIYRHCIKIIIDEVISGSCKFVMPYNSSGEIYFGTRPVSVLKHKCQNGTNQFDLFATDRTMPQLKYRTSDNTKRKDLNIYVSKDKYKTIVDRANTGVKFSKRPRELSYFLPRVYAQFPDLDEVQLRKSLFYCFRKMGYHLRRGEELRFIDKEGEIRFYRSLGKAHDFVMRGVVKRRK